MPLIVERHQGSSDGAEQRCIRHRYPTSNPRFVRSIGLARAKVKIG